MTAVRIPQAPLVRDARAKTGPPQGSLRLVASDGRLVRPTAAPRRLSASVYRRRRRAVASLTLGLTAAVVWLASIAVGSGGASASPSRPRPASYVVQPGDTIWSIAQRFARPGEHVGLAAQLVRANGSSQVQVGQTLVIPAG